MNSEMIELFKNHDLKIWYEENKNRWCVYGQAGVIAICLRATRATHIEIENEIFLLSDVTFQIYNKTDIKLAFQRLIF